MEWRESGHHWRRAPVPGEAALPEASLGGTGGGLTLGAKVAAPWLRVVCCTPMDSVAVRRPKMLAEANAAAAHLGIGARLSEGDVTMHDEYIRAAYGVPTDEGLAAIRLVARTEGILLEPTDVHGEGGGRPDRPRPPRRRRPRRDRGLRPHRRPAGALRLPRGTGRLPRLTGARLTRRVAAEHHAGGRALWQ